MSFLLLGDHDGDEVVCTITLQITPITRSVNPDLTARCVQQEGHRRRQWEARRGIHYRAPRRPTRRSLLTAPQPPPLRAPQPTRIPLSSISSTEAAPNLAGSLFSRNAAAHENQHQWLANGCKPSHAYLTSLRKAICSGSHKYPAASAPDRFQPRKASAYQLSDTIRPVVFLPASPLSPP